MELAVLDSFFWFQSRFQTLPKGSMYPIIGYLGFGLILVQVLGEHMNIEYLDP